MIILSDCLTDRIDEGCIKVANSLTKRLKQIEKNITVITYKQKSNYSDVHMS